MRANTYHYSIVFFTIIVLSTASMVFHSALVPSQSVPLAVYTLAVLACISVQVVERFFTTPRDVLVNASGLLLVLLPLKPLGMGSSATYAALVIWAAAALCFSLFASMLYAPEQANSIKNQLSDVF